MKSVTSPYMFSEHVMYLGIRHLIKKKAAALFVEDQSTIPVELAEALLESISFTMQYYNEHNTANLSELLNDESRFLNLYDNAESFLNRDIKIRELEFNQRLGLLYKLHNRAYMETVFVAINGFFKHYDAKFKAQDYIITADYPLARENRTLKGLSFINHYIESLMIEQQFMAAYSEGRIHAFLRQYHRDYYELIFNISELIFNNGLLLHLLKSPTENLVLSKNDIEMLYVTLLDESPDGIFRILLKTFDSYMTQLQLKGTSCYDYYFELLKPLSRVLYCHCENESLSFFLVCQP